MNGFRYENKYVLTTAGYRMLRTRLRALMEGDANVNEQGEYFIRSLYFDDAFQTGLTDKREGALLREKFRIRFYNMDDSFIRLESKQKHDYLTKKESAVLTRAMVEDILAGELWDLYDTDQPLLRSFYLKSRNRRLRPAVIVDYTREAYTFEDVRITFDKRLHSGLFSHDLFNPELNGISPLEPGQMILEVKYNRYLPEHIKGILSTVPAACCAISKYTLCRSFEPISED